MSEETFYVKVSIPALITDNPMTKFVSACGKFTETVPLNTSIVRMLKGRYDAYFILTKNSVKILNMKPISETEYLNEKVKHMGDKDAVQVGCSTQENESVSK